MGEKLYEGIQLFVSHSWSYLNAYVPLNGMLNRDNYFMYKNY